jgi:hypothetical protein
MNARMTKGKATRQSPGFFATSGLSFIPKRLHDFQQSVHGFVQKNLEKLNER